MLLLTGRVRSEWGARRGISSVVEAAVAVSQSRAGEASGGGRATTKLARWRRCARSTGACCCRCRRLTAQVVGIARAVIVTDVQLLRVLVGDWWWRGGSRRSPPRAAPLALLRMATPLGLRQGLPLRAAPPPGSGAR